MVDRAEARASVEALVVAVHQVALDRAMAELDGCRATIATQVEIAAAMRRKAIAEAERAEAEAETAKIYLRHLGKQAEKLDFPSMKPFGAGS